jgi:uncharacterized protein with beta-barrel porin domain
VAFVFTGTSRYVSHYLDRRGISRNLDRRGTSRTTGHFAVAAGAIIMVLVTFTDGARAQCDLAACSPPPMVSVASANSAISSEFTAFDLGSRFLQSLAEHASSSFGGGYTLPNPAGGGAGDPPAHFRSWVETYGLWSSTAGQGDFVGDHRGTIGGVAGFGMNVAPGAWVGISVDESHTDIDVPAAMQHGIFDLTQLGLNGSYEFGPWTISGAVVRGFGSVGENRDTTTGPAGASYDGDLWGAISELSYYWGLGNTRIVPKIGFDWVRTQTDAYSESGESVDIASVPEAVSTRARALAGAEIGHVWMLNGTLIDLSGYGRFVDIVSQSNPTLLVTSATGTESPSLLQGPLQGQYGADAGATLSIRLTELSRVYLGFDSHFRDGYQAYGGTIGGEIKW